MNTDEKYINRCDMQKNIYIYRLTLYWDRNGCEEILYTSTKSTLYRQVERMCVCASVFTGEEEFLDSREKERPRSECGSQS